MKLIERINVLPEAIETEKLPPGVLCRVRYPICNIGQLNANRRLYEAEVWDKVEQNPEIQEKLKNRTLFGHAEHPQGTTQSNLEKTSHVVTRIWREEKDGKLVEMAEFDVLDTPFGRIIDTLLKAGCKVGVSTRAEGELEERVDEELGRYYRVVPEQYRFITVDFTADPSTYGAVPESVERNVTDIIKQGLEQKKIDKEFAELMLQNFRCEEAVCLLESIRKEQEEEKEELKEEKKEEEKPEVKEDIDEDNKEHDKIVAETWEQDEKEDIISEFQAKIRDLEIKLATMEAEKVALENKYKKLIESAADDILRLNEEIKRLEEESAEKDEILEAKKFDIEKFRKAVRQFDDYIEELKQKMANVESKLKEAEAKLDEYVNKLKAKEEEVKEMKKKFEAEKSELMEQAKKEKIRAYVEGKLSVYGIELPQKAQALLEQCETEADVDRVFEDIRVSIREGVLHSSIPEQLVVIEKEKDEEEQKVFKSIGLVFEGMKGKPTNNPRR